MPASIEVADIFRAAGPAYRAARAGHLNFDQLKMMSAIEHCRTACLHPAGRGRRHRSQEQGGGLRSAVPSGIGDDDDHCRRPEAPWRPHRHHRGATHFGLGNDPHPHIHMIVPGGGLSTDGSRWISSRRTFLVPVRVLGKLFRRLFLTRLMALYATGRLSFGSFADLADRRAFLRHLAPVRKKRWVVYAKSPFAGPETVLAYLSRYTHRVAISNSRLPRFDQTGVTFRYKDYRRAALTASRS